MIAVNDKPRAEVVVDVQILEVNRERAKQYGLNLTEYAIGGIFSPEVAPGGGPFEHLDAQTSRRHLRRDGGVPHRRDRPLQ